MDGRMLPGRTHAPPKRWLRGCQPPPHELPFLATSYNFERLLKNGWSNAPSWSLHQQQPCPLPTTRVTLLGHDINFERLLKNEDLNAPSRNPQPCQPPPKLPFLDMTSNFERLLKDKLLNAPSQRPHCSPTHYIPPELPFLVMPFNIERLLNNERSNASRLDAPAAGCVTASHAILGGVSLNLPRPLECPLSNDLAVDSNQHNHSRGPHLLAYLYQPHLDLHTASQHLNTTLCRRTDPRVLHPLSDKRIAR
ncbi:hypothetical protein BKA80DRAFT_110313 [Phyllosticta citrichinensis]